MKSAIFSILALAAATPAQAEVVLWRTLEVGDPIEAVKAKLEAMPEVKRVKVVKKKGAQQLDINMNEGSVPIFDGHFDVTTQFNGGKLARVHLTSGNGCLDDAYPVAEKIAEELERKYPEVAQPFPDSSTFAIRALDSTSTRTSSVAGGYIGDDVGVMFQATFLRADPPQYFGGTALNRSLYQIARSTYDLRAQHCGGAYYRTAQFTVSYLSRDDWDTIRKEVEADNEAARRKASDNL